MHIFDFCGILRISSYYQKILLWVNMVILLSYFQDIASICDIYCAAAQIVHVSFCLFLFLKIASSSLPDPVNYVSLMCHP